MATAGDMYYTGARIWEKRKIRMMIPSGMLLRWELTGGSRGSFKHPETKLNPRKGNRERSSSTTSTTRTVSLVQKGTAVATGFMPVLSDPSSLIMKAISESQPMYQSTGATSHT